MTALGKGVPGRLNGYPVIRSREHAHVSTVMVEKGEADGIAGAEFVVCTWWPELGSTWMWGHYFTDRSEADADFEATGRRNGKRT